MNKRLLSLTLALAFFVSVSISSLNVNACELCESADWNNLRSVSFEVDTAFVGTVWQDYLASVYFMGLPIYQPGAILSSKPPIGFEELAEGVEPVSLVPAKLVYEVGTVLAFSYVRDDNGQFSPSFEVDFGSSYWADLLNDEMIIILDDSLKRNSVSATRISYGYEVTLTQDMVGKRLGIGIYGEHFDMSGGANESILELQVVSIGSGSTPQPTPAPLSVAAPNTNDIKVTVDGQHVIFTDQHPAIIDGRTLVPVRGVFETMGFTIGWNNESQQAALTRGSDVVVITIGNSTFTTNGMSRTLDVPAQIIGGRTMIPLRAVLESVGYNLKWDETTRTVIVLSNGEAYD